MVHIILFCFSVARKNCCLKMDIKTLWTGKNILMNRVNVFLMCTSSCRSSKAIMRANYNRKKCSEQWSCLPLKDRTQAVEVDKEINLNMFYLNFSSSQVLWITLYWHKTGLESVSEQTLKVVTRVILRWLFRFLIVQNIFKLWFNDSVVWI